MAVAIHEKRGNGAFEGVEEVRRCRDSSMWVGYNDDYEMMIRRVVLLKCCSTCFCVLSGACMGDCQPLGLLMGVINSQSWNPVKRFGLSGARKNYCWLKVSSTGKLKYWDRTMTLNPMFPPILPRHSMHTSRRFAVLAAHHTCRPNMRSGLDETALNLY